MGRIQSSQPDEGTKTVVIVLAGHGAPATDYPPWRVGLLMMLESSGKLAHKIELLRALKIRLASGIARWPRTQENDPYKAAVESLAASLAQRLGWPVIVGYNEFCSPTIDQALDQAVFQGTDQVVVIPTMLVRGNQHTELEIREAVDRARARHPKVCIHYAWPLSEELLVGLLANEVESRLLDSPTRGRR